MRASSNNQAKHPQAINLARDTKQRDCSWRTTKMTGALTDANLRSLHDLQEGDEYSAGSSLPLSDIQDQSQFKDEPHSVVSSSKRSLLNESSAGHHQGLTARRKDDLYGSEGDLLWKALVISLLTMIGTAAGFVYLYGLIQGDLDTTGKVSFWY